MFDMQKVKKVNYYIERQMKKEISESWESVLDKEEWSEFERIIEELSYEEYKEDIDIATYMLSSYAYAEDYALDEDVNNFLDNLNNEEYDRMKGTRGRWNEGALDSFPLQIDKQRTSSWCREYQKTFLDFENFDIFDTEKGTKDITRYGFQKMKKIYNTLMKANIENVLLMDISLGISLTGCIYGYMQKEGIVETIDRVEKIINQMTKIPCIYVRKKVANMFLDILARYEFSYEKVNEIESILKNIVPIISRCYWVALYTEWNKFIREENLCENDLSTMEESLKKWWITFYNDKIMYQSVLIMKQTVPLNENTPESMLEKYEELKMVFELPPGEKIRKYCFTISEEDVKQGNYLEKIREVNNYIFYKSIEIKRPRKKMNEIQLYALIHEKIVSGCLQTLFDIREG